MEKIDERFESFSDEIYKAMTIVDHERWDYDSSHYAIDEIKLLADEFKTPLEIHSFNLDKAMFEFRELKKVVFKRYKHLKPAALWEVIFSSDYVKYPHFLLVIEIVLSMFWSSSTVERGFSTVNRILTDARLSLSKDALNDLMMIKVNCPVLTKLDSNYEIKMIKKAVNDYLSKKRYHNTKARKKAAPVVTRSVATENSEDLFLPQDRPLSAMYNPIFDMEEDNMLLISSDEGELSPSSTPNVTDDEDDGDQEEEQSDTELPNPL